MTREREPWFSALEDPRRMSVQPPLNVAMRVLLRLAEDPHGGPLFPKTIERDLNLSRASVRRGLYALLTIGFAERGHRHREGVLWSLTPAGHRAANSHSPPNA